MQTFLVIMWAISLFLAMTALYKACMLKIDRDYWKSLYEACRQFADDTEKRFYGMMKIADEEHRAKQILCNDLVKRLTHTEYTQLQEIIDLERLGRQPSATHTDGDTRG